MAEHALLSASGAERWLACTPSARLEEKYPDKDTFYTLEGTMAHEIGELKLRKYFIEPIGARSFKSRMKKIMDDKRYAGLEIDSADMDRYTDAYLEYVSAVAMQFTWRPHVALEKRVDYSAYVPKGFGTCDCILLAGKDLHIIDFKYGKGVPKSAELNPQMMLYALGAYVAYSMLYEITAVTTHIVQPRIDSGISSYNMSIQELLAWGESIKPIAQAAFDGVGDYVPGEHCKFCKVKALCRARAEINLSLEADKRDPALLSDDEIGAILKRAGDLTNWAKALEEYALTACLDGRIIPGFKSVAGRSNRAFSDLDKAFAHLIANNVPEASLYNRVPVTLTAVEELLGKKEFDALLKGFIVKPAGKPTLVQDTDKREAITNKITAQEAFKDLKKEENE